MVTASVTVRCLPRASHMAGLSARSCRRLLASSGGRQVLSRHFCVDSRVRACQRHTSTLQDPARHFLGSMVAGNCLFDMPSRRCGQKRHTAPTGATGRQQDSYGHEKANRDCLSVYLSMYLSISPCIDLCIYRCIYLSIYLSICLSVYLSVCLSVCLSIYLSISSTQLASLYLSLFLSLSLSSNYLSIYLSIYLPVYLSLPFICLSV